MTQYTERIAALNAEHTLKVNSMVERSNEVDYFQQQKDLYLDRETALKYLVVLSEDSTKVIRDYLEKTINGALNIIFGKNLYKFHLISDLQNQKVELVLSEFSKGAWRDLDISLTAGDGMGQVIAILYSIILTEITHHRKLFLVDEVIGGLHQDAVVFIKKCLVQFAKHGAQFVMIEYPVEDFGKTYTLTRIKNGPTHISKVDTYTLNGQLLDSQDLSEGGD